MNPGPVEDAGKVATGIVDALKAQPAVLALTVMNFGMIVLIFYALQMASVDRDNTLVYQREMSTLLSKCVVPNG